MIKSTIENVDIVDGKLRVSTHDYLFGIAEGIIENHEPWSKMGFATGLTTEATITPQLGNYVFPTTGMQMSVKSTDNDNDKAGGTGALVITVYYLNNNYQEKSENIILTGTSWVDTVATDIYRVNNIRVSTTGTAGKPAGSISIADKATRAIVYGYVLLGTNRQRQLVYTVPAGKTLYIVNATVSGVVTASNKYIRTTLLANYDDKARSITKPGSQFLAYSESVLSVNSFSKQYEIPIKFISKIDLKVNAVSDGTATVNVALRGWMEKDDR
jgi:hypothetical protein